MLRRNPARHLLLPGTSTPAGIGQRQHPALQPFAATRPPVHCPAEPPCREDRPHRACTALRRFHFLQPCGTTASPQPRLWEHHLHTHKSRRDDTPPPDSRCVRRTWCTKEPLLLCPLLFLLRYRRPVPQGIPHRHFPDRPPYETSAQIPRRLARRPSRCDTQCRG